MAASSTQLDRYRHISALGSGGMATVVLAEDTLLGRRVALKRTGPGADARGLSRLRREALIGASVSHPNLVSIYDVLTSDDGEHVIVMEYVPGETLRDALAKEGKLAAHKALRILDGVAAALDAIHRQGIIHRDVKPANILLSEDGTIKLADLGIASVADRTKITTAGALLGTFSYMAPEQLSGERATPGTDVYALAAVAFEMLSGRKARSEPNPIALAHAISTQPPPDLRDVSPEAPAAAAAVLRRGMSRDPQERPKSASELVKRLRAALVPEVTAPLQRRTAPRVTPAAAAAQRRPPAAAAAVAMPPERRDPPAAGPVVDHGQRRARLLLAALLGLVAAAVILVVLLSGGGGSQRTSTTGSTGSARHRTHRAHTAGASASTGAGTSSTSSGTGSVANGTSSGSAGTSSGSAATEAPGASATSGSAAAGSATTPISAVESFYRLAASHSYSSAWALADPTFHQQLGGYRSFEAGQAADRSITFNSARVIKQSASSATVAIQTTSVRDSGTQQCSGTVDLSHGASAWLLHQIHINCS